MAVRTVAESIPQIQRSAAHLVGGQALNDLQTKRARSRSCDQPSGGTCALTDDHEHKQTELNFTICWNIEAAAYPEALMRHTVATCFATLQLLDTTVLSCR